MSAPNWYAPPGKPSAPAAEAATVVHPEPARFGIRVLGRLLDTVVGVFVGFAGGVAGVAVLTRT